MRARLIQLLDAAKRERRRHTTGAMRGRGIFHETSTATTADTVTMRGHIKVLAQYDLRLMNEIILFARREETVRNMPHVRKCEKHKKYKRTCIHHERKHTHTLTRSHTHINMHALAHPRT